MSGRAEVEMSLNADVLGATPPHPALAVTLLRQLKLKFRKSELMKWNHSELNAQSELKLNTQLRKSLDTDPPPSKRSALHTTCSCC